jgi:hypothetical protein
VLLFASYAGVATSVEKGFKALSIYDYFLAKKTFYKLNKKKNNPYACYGLAVIYSRADNPFTNIDSAAKYVHLSYAAFIVKPVKQKLSGFDIDSVNILLLCNSIGTHYFLKTKSKPGIDAYNNFLLKNYLVNVDLKEQVLYLRDQLEYNRIILKNKSDSTTEFINTHPQSYFLTEALTLRQRQIYDENTAAGKKENYIAFISKYPANIMLNSAYENLYKIYRDEKNVQGLKTFVLNYPKAPQNTEAWKLLFSLTVKSFSNEELEKFLVEFPAFPFRNSILKELELNKVKLFPYEKDDLFGFIDTTGKLVVKAEYDAVSDFYEGLSVVNKNDSVYFINKENQNVFNLVFSEAHIFKNGIAAVKKGNKWAFINRQGQVISDSYDEVSELSNQVYVVKVNNKYGALNHLGQPFIEPRYQKLGDFKNEFAYYIEDGKYGFISKSGYVYKADLDWISDFNESNIAIIKQNGSFGLINSSGNIILEPQYDLILKAANNNFVVVKNSLYGFYTGTGCFVANIAYDFMKEKPDEFYTNGSVFKLIRKNEQAIVDINGKPHVDFGAYDEINFAHNNLIRAKKKNKYGYLDRKLNTAIPFRFQEARDFSDSLAVVKLKDKFSLINTSGKEIFTTESSIEKLSAHYYTIDGDGTEIINNKGESVFINIKSIQEVNKKLFIVTLNSNEIKFLRD